MMTEIADDLFWLIGIPVCEMGWKNYLLFELGNCFAGGFYMKNSTKLLSLDNHKDYLGVKTDGAQFRIYLLDENIIRIRGTFDDEFAPEESYALVKTAWDDVTDEFMADERKKVTPIPVEVKETDDGQYLVSNGKYQLHIHKDPFYFEIEDPEGNIVHSDVPKRAFVEDDNGRRTHYSKMGDHEKFYGFGEKSGKLNKYRRRMRMHNTDSLGWDATQSDPLYKMIPFYIDFNTDNNTVSGLYYNNSNDSVFDMDAEHSNYWLRYSYFQTDGGDLDVFFIGGPTIKDVVEHYTDLTGKSAMMPLSSFGYMGSTMFYSELEEGDDEAILNFVDNCQKNDIPVDGFFLSSGYVSDEQDGKRYFFRWNKRRFPDPEQFVNDLKKRGVLVAPNIKPGILLTHPLDAEFAAGDAYVKDANDDQNQVNQYWGGPGHFIDFTKEAGRQEWSKQMTESLLKIGVTSIWNDNNEYETVDGDATVYMEGNKDKKMDDVRPLMSTIMAKTAHTAIHAYDENARPYVINRAGFAGIQRYAQTWAGDNFTSWDSVKYNIPTILGMGLSGVANQGCDIGGFYGPLPEPEMFVRWVQNGIFQPRFSIHSANTDNTVTEPWTFPEYTKYISAAIKLRYTLVPYFYSLLYEASTKGSPIMRPLVYEFQSDPKVADESFEFMLGASLLVANVVDEGQTQKDVYLPAGATWLDLKTNKLYEGGQTITIPVDLSSIPMFLRSGGIIPRSPRLTNIHKQVIDQLDLLVEPSVDSTFDLYEDDGENMDYKKGKFLVTHVTSQADPEGVTLTFDRQGDYTTKVKEMDLSVYCPKMAPINVKVAGKELHRYLNHDEYMQAADGWYFDGETRQAKVRYQNPGDQKYTVNLEFTLKDLISIQ